MKNLHKNPAYAPNALLDFLLEKLNLKNDAALSRALEIAPPALSKIRHRKLPIGASILVKAHELTEMPTKQLKEIMGIGAP